MTLQQSSGGLWIPNYHSFVGVGGDADELDTAGKRAGMIFAAPLAGVLDTFEFLAVRLGGLGLDPASVVRVSFQNVDGSGVPDGTQDQYRDILGSSIGEAEAFGAPIWQSTGLMTSDGTDVGTKRTVALGELVAAVIQYQTFTALDDFYPATAAITSQAVGSIAVGRPYYVFHNGTSWAKTAARTPLVGALRYSTGEYVFIAPSTYAAVSQANVNLASDSSPDEAGMKFRLAADALATAVWVNVSRTSGGASSEIVLYDPGDGVIARVIVPVGLLEPGNGNAGNLYAPLPEDIPIEHGVEYRLTVKATSPGPGKVSILYVPVQTLGHLGTCQGGNDFTYTERTDLGVWVDNNLRRPIMGLEFSAFGDGVGGGSGGGFVAVSRGFKRGMV